MRGERERDRHRQTDRQDRDSEKGEEGTPKGTYTYWAQRLLNADSRYIENQEVQVEPVVN